MSKNKTSNHQTGHIIQSLVINLVITAAKAVAAFMTKSGAMLAETIHSFADCSNQLLLLVGVRQSNRAPDAKHPLGYGRVVYFWSFMVAMLLFSIGGMFSIYEGVHKYNHPEPVENVLWGVGILIFSIVLESFATFGNIREMNKRRGEEPFFKYIRTTKDSDLVVIFGENSAAVIGLFFALAALIASFYTGDGRYDAAGSFLIGLVLIAVAIFLAVEVKSLLIGESADPIIEKTASKIAKEHPKIKQLLQCITVQQGPGEVVLCVKIACEPHLAASEVSDLINDFEAQMRAARPEVKWIFIEPDLSSELKV